MQNLASQPILREGRFLFSVMHEPEVAEYDSGAEALRLQLQALREWSAENGEWKDLTEREEIRAEFFITKKTGESIQNTIEMLLESVRLDLNDPTICGADYIGRMCQGDVRVDTYGGNVRYRVTRIFPENTVYRPAKIRRLGVAR